MVEVKNLGILQWLSEEARETIERKTDSGRMELRLSDLKDGESGIITSISTHHRRWHGQHRRTARAWGFRKRLEDMGLTPGTKVTVVKSAPFRGPVEIYVRGSRLAVGKGMAERIFVEVER